MAKFKKKLVSVLALGCALTLSGGLILGDFGDAIKKSEALTYQGMAKKSNGLIDTNIEQYFDKEVVYQLPSEVVKNENVSIIVTMDTVSVMDAYKSSGSKLSLSEYATSKDARKISQTVNAKKDALLKRLKKAEIPYVLGEKYDTLFGGFEITTKAENFEKIGELFGADAEIILGDEYLRCETIVNNKVDVYETGIFDSSSYEYQGDGVVVAVLDTGLDYTHTAFSPENFQTIDERFDLAYINDKIEKADTNAARLSPGLTGADVYVNAKVPFAYDYADNDPDVLPINSEHGTHVAGVIAGDDDTITGVAPNAQLAIMKVFSDTRAGAKQSWILAAVEDCVKLGVDVINMSLGSSCGFTTERSHEMTSKIYNSVKEAGISLVAAGNNDFNATHGSTKNGSLGLTSNPDSGTVGAPATYPAAIAVASVDGVKTPYLFFNENVIYFNEASGADGKMRDFVSELLKTVGDVESYDFEYVTIPGIGRASDYPHENEFYHGKIVLVKRGDTTFEEKARIALEEKGAAGIIIYNNVSGDISMSIGKSKGAVCSISQDDGELLASAGTGVLHISQSQVAGPYMSDFSSWGPTSDLKIKPEITAHGGEILSAVPGQEYDRLSGTSMASPNLAGVSALIRQYVRQSGLFGTFTDSAEDMSKLTSLVNQLMMSTADIVYNKNGLPYAVRKQGAGLVNIGEAITTASYITTYENGQAMDKSKLELGDDKAETGIYEMSFDITNVSSSAVTYAMDALVQTEGVSKTYTSHGETTVTQDGYMLDGAKFTLVEVEGDGTANGNKVTVLAGKTAKVIVKVVLSDGDKAYLRDSFENGMYVEGFITMDAVNGTSVDVNVPFLAFFGDWTKAPIFDEEFYDTHKDEINDGLDDEDKLMPDAYATRILGGLYSDYISTLGAYYFTQKPGATKIPASKDHIAISNQEGRTVISEDGEVDEGVGATINSLYAISAGLLRNSREVEISIVEDSTGREIFNRVSYNQNKSYGISSIRPSSIDVDFKSLEHKLKNNTKYTVTVSAYIDYEGEQKNTRNTFEFPLYIDFEAPAVTGVTYRKEYDKNTQKTKLFADLEVYDNHYAMALQLGQIIPADPSSEYDYAMEGFGKYLEPVYSSYNSTTMVTVELTDYVSKIKNSVAPTYDEDGNALIDYNSNTFLVICYDYALNNAMYELSIPDEVVSMYFGEKDKPLTELRLSPNETKDLTNLLQVFPNDTWVQSLDFESSNTSVIDVVNQTAVAKSSGTATITAIGYNANGERETAKLNVTVLSPGDEGYNGTYTVPEVNNFAVTGYHVNKAFFSIYSEEREIGLQDYDYEFGNSLNLSMYPSESVTLKYTLDSYSTGTTVTYKSNNEKRVKVSDDGTILAVSEGKAVVTATVTKANGETTTTTNRITIEVKDPFTTSSIYLNSYRGNGGTVEIPSDRGITIINSYAFSGWDYVDKDLSAGDVIDEEDPYHIKQMYLGDDTITKVIIPEGVTTIEEYAFANLTALEEIEIRSTKLVKIGVGAFFGCEKLKKINLENVKFINQKAFFGCALETLDLSSVVAIGNYAFENCNLISLALPASSQSLGVGAFYNNDLLMSVEFGAPKMKIGSYAFAECNRLGTASINAAVVASYAFFNCSQLSSVTLGKDISVIGEYAFAGTSIKTFKEDNNPLLSLSADKKLVFNGSELVLVAPAGEFDRNTVDLTDYNVTSISTGAFAGNKKVYSVIAPEVVSVGAYAFADCANLNSVSMDELTKIGQYAFAGTALTALPNMENVTKIGDYAFAFTKIQNVSIADGTTIGKYAFAYITPLNSVTVGDDVIIGEGAFYNRIYSYSYDVTGRMDYYDVYDYVVKDENGNVVKTYSYYRYNFMKGVQSNLASVTVGNDVEIGKDAFGGNAKLTTLNLGTNVSIGDYAFFNSASLTAVDLTNAVSVGAYAFSGSNTQDLWLNHNEWALALEREYVDGEIVDTNYIYTDFTPEFATANLLNAKTIGEGAFASNQTLESVTLSEELDCISAYAFYNCENLDNVTIPANVATLGKYAFYRTAITAVDAGSATEIGDYAFADTNVETLELKEGVVIGQYAFYNCEELATVSGLENAYSIGKYAFYKTAITEVSLKGVTYLGSFAFADSKVTSVIFADEYEMSEDGRIVAKTSALTAIRTEETLVETIDTAWGPKEEITVVKESAGNPFSGCLIKPFTITMNAKFNDKVVGTDVITTYDVSDTIKVINGVLYQVVENGLELICYPIETEEKSYVVEDGTVRIAARAFENSMIENVTIARTVKAIGDKAFYGCNELKLVVFKGYDAPILEEEYDLSYLSLESLPFTGVIGTYEGLYEGAGIVPFYMWNATSNYTNFYYGANFVDYVGFGKGNVVMISPVNGQNYDTFILSKYFGMSVSGDNAPMEQTLKVLDLIEKLPSATEITLSHKAQIEKARAEYNLITSYGQMELVTNYSKLTNAEATIKYLEQQGSSTPTPPPSPVGPEEEPDNVFAKNAVGIIVAIVLVLAFGTVGVIYLKKGSLIKKSVEEQKPVDGEEVVEKTEESSEKVVEENESTEETEE